MSRIEESDPLGLYFGRFLHQDWMHEFPSLQATFDELLSLLDRAGLERLVEQLDLLLELDPSVLDAEMRRRSPDLNPSQDLGISDAEWLRSLMGRAAAELEARGGATA